MEVNSIVHSSKHIWLPRKALHAVIIPALAGPCICCRLFAAEMIEMSHRRFFTKLVWSYDRCRWQDGRRSMDTVHFQSESIKDFLQTCRSAKQLEMNDMVSYCLSASAGKTPQMEVACNWPLAPATTSRLPWTSLASQCRAPWRMVRQDGRFNDGC